VREREVKREAVIRAAAHAFNRKGYHNTSLDDIAAALDVTKPTVYYYVTSKEQLLFECFVAGVEQIRAAFRTVKKLKVPAGERLNGVLRHYGEAVASEFGWCMVRAEEQDLPPAMSSHIKALKSEIDQGIRRLIREGIQDGSIQPCDPKMTAFALAGALNWIAHWYRENQSMTGAEIADAFVTIFESGLSPRTAAATGEGARRPRPRQVGARQTGTDRAAPRQTRPRSAGPPKAAPRQAATRAGR
jgi:AcrR family transcriptional regulator